MDYLTSGNSCLDRGVSLIAYGAFLTSLGWFLLAKRKEVNKWLKKHIDFMPAIVGEGIITISLCFLLITGPRAVGEDGKLTTKGWNLLKSHEQKKALIVGLAREWLLNELYTIRPPMSFDANDPKLGEKHFMYPQFRTSAQDRILTSELFDMTDRKDKELLSLVATYEEVIKSFNTLLAWENELCVRFPENVEQQKRKEVYLLIRDKAPLHIHFKRFHKELLKLLEKEYSWALAEARPALANIHRLQE